MKSVLVGKKIIQRADMAARRFFYDACIPTNVVNSFYFKSMLDAISVIGHGYEGPNQMKQVMKQKERAREMRGKYADIIYLSYLLQ